MLIDMMRSRCHTRVLIKVSSTVEAGIDRFAWSIRQSCQDNASAASKAVKTGLFCKVFYVCSGGSCACFRVAAMHLQELYSRCGQQDLRLQEKGQRVTQYPSQMIGVTSSERDTREPSVSLKLCAPFAASERRSAKGVLTHAQMLR